MRKKHEFQGNILFTLDNAHYFFYFAAYRNGSVAQLVEQWTENPRVVGSTPIGTTKTPDESRGFSFFYNLANFQ